MPDIDDLNQQFGLGDKLTFTTIGTDQAGLIIQTDLCHAKLVLQGAHLIEWTPRGEKPVIWLSDAAHFAPGKSIRGGIPVCWPWFGAHPSNKDFPAHGYARTVDWDISASAELADGRIELTFVLRDHDGLRNWWPGNTPVSLQMVLGETLQLVLTTDNAGNEPVTLTEALHTYFAVSDLHQVTVTGLDGCDYLDKVENFARFTQQGDVRFEAEVDRVYLDTTASCIIHDSLWQREIRIEKQGGHSTVVWNPWQETGAAMGDLGSGGYASMLCVESANAASNAVQLAAGESHRLEVTYSVQQTD